MIPLRGDHHGSGLFGGFAYSCVPRGRRERPDWSPKVDSLRGRPRALSEKPEPACEGTSLRHSRGQLTPLGQRGGPVFFKDAATIEVTILIEVIVDRGVN